jgi:predicted acylesterase/phospholipase RssA
MLAVAEDMVARAKAEHGDNFRSLEAALKWDCARIAGVSVGAINAVKLGQHKLGHIDVGAKELVDLWRKLDDKDVKRGSQIWGLVRFALGSQSSVWDQEKYLGALIEREMDLPALRQSVRNIYVGSVNLKTRAYVVHDESRDDFVKCVLASSSFPILFKPIRIDGDLHADGGLRNMAPLAELVRDNVEHITVVGTADPDLEGDEWIPCGALSYIERVVDIMTNELARNDFQVTGLKNDLAEVSDKYRNVHFDLIMPDRALDDRETLVFDNKTNRLWVDEGYETAAAIMKRRREEEEVYGDE